MEKVLVRVEIEVDVSDFKQKQRTLNWYKAVRQSAAENMDAEYIMDNAEVVEGTPE